MNTERNTPEISGGEDRIGFSPVEPKKKKPRRKKSLFKSQIFTIILLGVCIAALAVGAAIAINRFAQTDGVIDTFTESFTSKESGKTSYTYYSKKTSDGTIVITDAAGKTLNNYFVDEAGKIVKETAEGATHIFETEMGSMLMLSDAGKITYFARVDFGGEFVGGDTGARVLIFPRAGQENIAEIFIHNVDKDGNVTEFKVIGEDTDKDKANDYFYIENYEGSTINHILSSALCSYAGYTISVKKLSIDFMEDYDEKHKNEAGYTPLVGADGKINFAEYGLEGDNYYELKTTEGNVHKLYLGNEVPDGSGLYVRYYDDSEGDRNSVYILSDDTGVGDILGMELTRTGLLLGKPEELVYPQISLPTTLNTYLLVENFTISKNDGQGNFKDITNFSFVDLDLRNFTWEQMHPYINNDPEILSGYLLDDSLLDKALLDLYDISSIMGAGYESLAVQNYVKVLRLVKNVIPDDLSKYYDDMAKEIVNHVEKAAAEDPELRALLAEYGLDSPESKFFCTPLTYNSSNTMVSDGIPTYIWVSKMTEQKTYYVWAPIYQQILEIGASYLDMLEHDEFDWASSSLFDSNIAFCDSIRVTGNDKDGIYQDILFELFHSYGFKFDYNYSFYSGSVIEYYDISGATYKLTVDVDENGGISLSLSSAVNYTVQYQNPQTGEIKDKTETHSQDFVLKMPIGTIKNYCKYFLDRTYVEKLSEEEKKAVEDYSRLFANATNNKITRLENGKVKIEHLISDYGKTADQNANYYFVPPTDYSVSFVFDPETDMLTLSVKQTSGGREVEVFSERIFRNLFADIVSNDGDPEFTEAERREILAMYSIMNTKTSEQEKLTVTKHDKNGAATETKTYLRGTDEESFIDAFKKFYTTILYTNYRGRVTESTGGVVGTVLTEEQVEEYKAKGDDCDLKMDIKIGVDGIRYTFRMYNYSVTRSFVTSNGDGIFYIDRGRAEKFISDAVKAAAGDLNITHDTTE